MRTFLLVTVLFFAMPALSGGAQQDGKAVYDRACAACHGDNGQGRLAPALVPFTRGSQDLLRIVRAGAGDMMMGFSAAEVSDADVRAIEQYLRGLSGRGGVPTAAPTVSSAPATATPATPAAGSTAAVSSAEPNGRASGRPIVEWPYVGADQSNTRYSPLDDITADNVDRLAIAWRWRPEERSSFRKPTAP